MKYGARQAIPPQNIPVDTWVLILNRYQRDNLLLLFNALGYGAKGVEPFTLMNNGDWAGEILQMLAKVIEVDGYFRPHMGTYTIDEDDSPNISLDELRNQVETWRKNNAG